METLFIISILFLLVYAFCGVLLFHFCEDGLLISLPLVRVWIFKGLGKSYFPCIEIYKKY